MSTGRFLGGLLVGGALGAIIGLLVAPRSGEETRELIREEIADRVNRSVDDVKYRSAEIRGRTLDTVDQLRERGQLLAEELEDTGKETWDKLRSSVKVGREPGETKS